MHTKLITHTFKTYEEYHAYEQSLPDNMPYSSLCDMNKGIFEIIIHERRKENWIKSVS